MEPVTTTAIIGTGAWFGNKLLGATVNTMGDDLKSLYEKGRDKIINNAISKTRNINDGAKTNLRVTRDVFWNGSFTDESICAEYFGGILASSRSKDGKNDIGIFYTDIIKSMSSAQLKLHYIIYRTLNKELFENKEKINLNPGQESELNREKILIPTIEIHEQLNEDFGAILHGLHALKLIGNFQTHNHELKNSQILPYLDVSPTSIGIQLFAIANNKFDKWRNFSKEDFEDFKDIQLPGIYAQSISVLLNRAKLESKIK